jgi:uncharacterized coiled-coil protein SlyX
MFSEESFQMPLEAQLKLRLVTDEIKKCTDVETLQNSLVATTELVARYQAMMGVLIKDMMEMEITVINNS